MLRWDPAVRPGRRNRTMIRSTSLAAALGLVVLVTVGPTISFAEDKCPVELSQAKSALASAQASLKAASAQGGKSTKEIQAPRTQAGAKSQDVQAPRGQDVQAPRGQDVQAPRAKAGAKSQDAKATVDKAAALIKQSEAACKKGDLATSKQKATEALALLKKSS
jgi:hypothetical protein